MEMLEHNAFTNLLNNVGWMYATLAVIHYFSIFIVVGTVAILDLRILGVAARSQGVAQLSETLSPWTWTALVLALLSGFTMFTTDAIDFFPDTVFRVKMTVLFLAIVFTIIVKLSVPKWDQSTAIPAAAKMVALVSLVLWVGTILAGVEIAAISGLG
jgi:uncharacterized membrane protein